MEKIEMILQISLWKTKSITEIGPKSGEHPSGAYGSVDITDDLSVDELLDLRDFVQRKIDYRTSKFKK